jgi:O-antigen/teichoic acid export membrane protein
MVPFTLKYLTKSEYGIFAISGDLLGWLSVANLGVTSAFNSRGGHLLGRKDYSELNALANTTFFAQLISSILVLLVGLAVCIMPNLVFGPENKYENINLVVFLIVFGFFIQYVTQPLNSLLIANKEVYVDNFLKFGLLGIQVSLNIILLIFGFKLMSLAISNLVSNIIISAITWFRIKKSFPHIEIRKKYWDSGLLKYLLKSGVWFSIGGIAGILILRMDSFIIGKYNSLALVALFVVNSKLYQIAEKLFSQFFNTLRPYFAQEFGKGEFNRLKEIYNTTCALSLLFAILLGVMVFFASEIFLDWWVGPEFYLGNRINLMLSVNFILQSLVLPNRILLATSLYKIEIHNGIRIVEGIFKMFISLFLIEEYGIEGVLIGSIFSTIFFSNIFLNILSNKLLGQFSYKRLLLNISSISLLLGIYFGLVFVLALFVFLMLLVILVERQNLKLAKNYILIFRRKNVNI